MVATLASIDVQHINPDFFGVALILTTIGTLGGLITVSALVIHTVRSILLARISRGLISELLAKGYAPEEVIQLVHGGGKPGSFQKWMAFSRQFEGPLHATPPVPPVKPRATV